MPAVFLDKQSEKAPPISEVFWSSSLERIWVERREHSRRQTGEPSQTEGREIQKSNTRKCTTTFAHKPFCALVVTQDIFQQQTFRDAPTTPLLCYTIILESVLPFELRKAWNTPLIPHLLLISTLNLYNGLYNVTTTSQWITDSFLVCTLKLESVLLCMSHRRIKMHLQHQPSCAH